MTARAPSIDRLRRALAGIAAGVAAALVLWLAGLHAPFAAIAGGVVAVAMLWSALQSLRLLARVVAADAEVESLVAQLAATRANQDALASDLAQLGNFGNLLLESIDLAEV